MLIGIEATRANKPTKTGVEWYAWHVIQELKKLTANDNNSWVLYSNHILTGGLEQLPENWYEDRIKWPLPFGWTQMRLSYELYKRPVEVLWLPGSTLPRYFPKQTVITVHDIGFHRYPKLYKPRQVHIHERAMQEIKKSGARILTVSEFSGREIAEAYGIDPSRIAITPNGIDHSVYQPITDEEAMEVRLRRYQISRPYFLSIGRLETKKNIVMLIKAFTSFKTRMGVGSPYRLVLAGAPGFGYEDIKREIANSTSKSDIIELGYVPESDKPYLMSAAEGLIHPSLYEGFGIPVLEAMAVGVPVVASDIPALHEVGSDAVSYASMASQDLADFILKSINTVGYRGAKIADGLERVKEYGWQKTAKLSWDKMCVLGE